MNNSFYFKHDNNAAHDDKILAVREKYGWEGYGFYWFILETMSRNDGYIKATLERGLSLGMMVDKILLSEYLDFCVSITLFKKDKIGYFSARLIQQLETRKVLSESGKRGVKIREENKSLREASSLSEGGLHAGEERRGEDRTEIPNGISVSAKKNKFISPTEIESQAAFVRLGFPEKSAGKFWRHWEGKEWKGITVANLDLKIKDWMEIGIAKGWESKPDELYAEWKLDQRKFETDYGNHPGYIEMVTKFLTQPQS